jgi:hypothetical protein
VKPPNWTGKNDSELDLVNGAELRGADLRYASAAGAFLVTADLEEAHLEGAELRLSDLRGAYLNWAYLDEADLTGAVLGGADLSRADLRNADLRFADFRANPSSVRGITSDALKSAQDWDKAYYDPDLLQKLGLPPDHNKKLAEEQKQEEQQKGQLAAGSTGAPAGQKPQLGPGKPPNPKQGNK